MKSLQQIKDSYATNLGHSDWESLVLRLVAGEFPKSTIAKLTEFERHFDNITTIVQQECLKNVSETANLNKYDCDIFGHRYFKGNVDGVSLENGYLYEINKDSITNENNIVR